MGCVWVGWICVFVCVVGVLNMSQARQQQDCRHKDGRFFSLYCCLAWTRSRRSTSNIYCVSSPCSYSTKLLRPTILHSLLPHLPFHTHSSTAPSNQPSVTKNKDLRQSTKGPPAQLGWWLCFGESFFFLIRPGVYAQV